MLKSAQLAAITAQLTAAGFNVSEFIAKDLAPTALKDAIEAKYPKGVAESEVISGIFGDQIETHDVATARAHVEQLADDLKDAREEAEKHEDSAKKHEASANLLGDGLKASGVKMPEATAEAPLTAEAIETAVKARVSVLASEQLAAAGIKVKDQPKQDVSPDATDPAKASKPSRNAHAHASLVKLGMDQ